MVGISFLILRKHFCTSLLLHFLRGRSPGYLCFKPPPDLDPPSPTDSTSQRGLLQRNPQGSTICLPPNCQEPDLHLYLSMMNSQRPRVRGAPGGSLELPAAGGEGAEANTQTRCWEVTRHALRGPRSHWDTHTRDHPGTLPVFGQQPLAPLWR